MASPIKYLYIDTSCLRVNLSLGEGGKSSRRRRPTPPFIRHYAVPQPLRVLWADVERKKRNLRERRTPFRGTRTRRVTPQSPIPDVPRNTLKPILYSSYATFITHAQQYYYYYYFTRVRRRRRPIEETR